jgi:hypothetical protein
VHPVEVCREVTRTEKVTDKVAISQVVLLALSVIRVILRRAVTAVHLVVITALLHKVVMADLLKVVMAHKGALHTEDLAAIGAPVIAEKVTATEAVAMADRPEATVLRKAALVVRE